jgi:hypothetical protein
MSHEVERIFRLMKLLSPSLDLKEAYMSARSTDAVRHANALEFLDNILSPQLRTLIVPLLDSEVTVAERVKLADRFLGFSAASEAAARPTPRRTGRNQHVALAFVDGGELAVQYFEGRRHAIREHRAAEHARVDGDDAAVLKQSDSGPACWRCGRRPGASRRGSSRSP